MDKDGPYGCRDSGNIVKSAYKKMKFALISSVLPPSESAQAMIIYRLLRDWPADEYCLISSTNYDSHDSPAYSDRLAGKYYHLPERFQFRRGTRFGLHVLRKWINFTLGTIVRAAGIARILRRENCDAVVVCTGGRGILDLPAGYLASRIVRARFYAYLLDQYMHMVTFVLGKPTMQRLEPMLLKGASAVIVHNEFLRKELLRRYGVDAVIIHNPCDLSAYEEIPPHATPSDRFGSSPGSKLIVYTGSVGNVHFDAFRNLVTAIKLVNRPEVVLHLYTAASRASVEEAGIRGPVVYHEHLVESAMPAVQWQADVLFLPLAFNSPYPEIVRTAAPGKMGEFLAARRPILVHAPPDSFIAWYFRHYECGLVVDHNDPAELARGLVSILDDEPLRKRLSANAWQRAQADFSLPKARRQFFQLLGRPSSR